MSKDNVAAAIHRQIQHELSNAYSYLAVSLYFSRLNFNGLAKYMRKQVEDERMHAQKFIDHLVDRGKPVPLAAIPAPKGEYASVLEAVRAVRDLERDTTARIHALYALAQEQADYPAVSLLKWFVDEQVEEEKWSEELASVVERIGDSVGGLFMLDHHWGKRAE